MDKGEFAWLDTRIVNNETKIVHHISNATWDKSDLNFTCGCCDGEEKKDEQTNATDPALAEVGFDCIVDGSFKDLSRDGLTDQCNKRFGKDGQESVMATVYPLDEKHRKVVHGHLMDSADELLDDAGACLIGLVGTISREPKWEDGTEFEVAKFFDFGDVSASTVYTVFHSFVT